MFNDSLVLDLSQSNGAFCSYLLAHVGCRVVSVEPVGGSAIRQQQPLHNNVSAWWQAYGRGNSSLHIDLDEPQSQPALIAWIKQADFLIHDWTESQAKLHHMTYPHLAEINPRLIVICITAYGARGPKSDWPATDLTIWAASGAHMLGGDADRAPVRTSVPQAFLHAGADAAGAALVADYERNQSNLGQFIDISAQQSCAQATLGANLATPNNSGYEVEREAGGLRGLFPIQLTWPCADGFVAITFLFGAAFDEPNRRLLQWLAEHDCCTQEEVDTDWGLELSAMTGEGKSPAPYFELCKKIEIFTRARNQQTLFEQGLARGIYIAPTLDIAGLLEEKHFIARNYWHQVQIGDKTVRVPGEFAKLSATPLHLPGPAAAPTLEQSSVEAATPTAQRQSSTTASSAESSANLPLSGLKVLDFMWVIAGPFFTRVLSDFGATVIKVESSIRVDPARGAATFKDGQPSIESGMPFTNFNAGKMSVTIDPSNPEGQAVIMDLLRWADIVTESFSPKAMQAWGLDYNSIKAINPSIIMLSSCLMGQTGPRSRVPGYGNMAAALTGFYDLTGWKDRSPAGPYLAYTDGVAPRFMLVALFAALEHRRRSGEGQHIDISQAEAAIHLLAPAIIDYQLSGKVWHRDGNRDLQYAPHGVYPTAGKDEWVAIACQSDLDWLALCTIMQIDPKAFRLEGATASQRQDLHPLIDEQISAWTASREGLDIETQLIAVGVAAHVVQNSAACYADPQLEHRHHYVSVPHTSLGTLVVENTRAHLSRTPGHVTRAGPELGEHNFHVLAEILGYDDNRIADIYASLAMQ